MKLVYLSILAIFLFHTPKSFAQYLPEQELDSIHKPIYQRLDSIGTLYEVTKAHLDTSTLSMQQELNFTLKALDLEVDKIWKERIVAELEFVKRHLTAPISLNVLEFDLIRPEGAKFYPVIKVLYEQMPKGLKMSKKGKEVCKEIIIYNNNQIGKKAPFFKVKDINKKVVSLNMFHNKYVLLDFWASVCIPCLEEFPTLEEVYSTYKSKGLEIISFSIDEDLQKWRTTIKKDSISEWRHVSVKENKPSISSLYFENGIPLLVLIDKKGLIVGRWLGLTEENTEAIKKTLKKIFEKQIIISQQKLHQN